MAKTKKRKVTKTASRAAHAKKKTAKKAGKTKARGRATPMKRTAKKKVAAKRAKGRAKAKKTPTKKTPTKKSIAARPAAKAVGSAMPAKTPSKVTAPLLPDLKESGDHDEDSRLSLDELREDVEIEAIDEEDLTEELPLEDDEEDDSDFLEKPETLATDDDDEYRR